MIKNIIFIKMISETILEKLKPSNSYVVKPTERSLAKLTKS